MSLKKRFRKILTTSAAKPQNQRNQQLNRVWRYFHHSKEGGFAKEDEGLLPVARYYGAKKATAPPRWSPHPGRGRELW